MSLSFIFVYIFHNQNSAENINEIFKNFRGPFYDLIKIILVTFLNLLTVKCSLENYSNKKNFESNPTTLELSSEWLGSFINGFRFLTYILSNPHIIWQIYKTKWAQTRLERFKYNLLFTVSGLQLDFGRKYDQVTFSIINKNWDYYGCLHSEMTLIP